MITNQGSRPRSDELLNLRSSQTDYPSLLLHLRTRTPQPSLGERTCAKYARLCSQQNSRERPLPSGLFNGLLHPLHRVGFLHEYQSATILASLPATLPSQAAPQGNDPSSWSNCQQYSIIQPNFRARLTPLINWLSAQPIRYNLKRVRITNEVHYTSYSGK